MRLEDGVVRVFRDRLPEVLGGRYEPRGQQLEMAVEVARTIEREGVAVLEAETGLGKSLAYLVPLVLYTADGSRRAVVSTHTRHLQRQLSESDLDLAVRACGSPVNAAVLMGRSNYACRRGILRVLQEEGDHAERDFFLRALLDDGIGDIEAFPGASLHVDEKLRRRICAPTGDTTCGGCRHRDDCFLFDARRHALCADLVITNHALVFSDTAADGALLGRTDAVVFDEAHHLEDVATTFLSVRLDGRAIRGGPESLIPADIEDIAAYAREMIRQVSSEDADRMESQWQGLVGSARDADGAVAQLFEMLTHAVATQRSIGGYPSRTRVYCEGTPLFYGAESMATLAADSVLGVAACAREIATFSRTHMGESEIDPAAAFTALSVAAAEQADAIRFVARGANEEYVFYASLDEEKQVTSLSASPVQVGPQLGAIIERCSAVLTSATLCVDDDFTYTVSRCGLGSAATTRRYATPFDFATHRRVVLARHVPEPGSPEFPDAAADLLEAIATAVPRRMLVLCTSYRQCSMIASRLRCRRSLSGRILSQEPGVPRGDLLDRFRDTPAGMLLGVASFWEGVDLPGDHVEIVVIVKLPFLVPDDPIVSARSRRVTESGEDAFERLFVPDVALRLRQGIGRLIRTGRDRGAVLLLDRRIATAAYGDTVLAAIGGEVETLSSNADVVASIQNFFQVNPTAGGA